MLNPMKWFEQLRPARKLRIVADPSATREDLQIKNLLDCPNLRRAMGLDEVDAEPLARPDCEQEEVAA